jgi:hypothetical protein
MINFWDAVQENPVLHNSLEIDTECFWSFRPLGTQLPLPKVMVSF